MSSAAAYQINLWLRGTPYLVAEGAAGEIWATAILDQQVKIANDIRAARATFADQAENLKSDLLRDFDDRLVFESNAIEGVTATLEQTREFLAIERAQDYIAEYSFKEGLTADTKMLEVVGHGGALRFVRDLATQLGNEQLREVDIRNIHRLAMASEPRIAGHYKTMDNEIAGRKFSTAKSDDVGLRVHELTEWLAGTNLQGPLAAAVVHAWLADLHPFDDGNGRVSRLIANYVLFKHAWPCLIIRSKADKERYYEALEQSDNGDIGPLFSLFVDGLSRTVADMCHPNFARTLVLSDFERASGFALWSSMLLKFAGQLAEACQRTHLYLNEVGFLTERDFAWLEKGDAAGNGWWAKVGSAPGFGRVLLWFGYASRELREATDNTFISSPSIFISVQDISPGAIHPYRPLWNDSDVDIHEVNLQPLALNGRVLIRTAGDVGSYAVPQAARMLAEAISSLV